MARIRQIKPQFFTDEDIVTLGPLARLFFIGLWTVADREGRLEDKPLTLKLQILPFDEVDPAVLLAELAARSLIYRYQVDGKRYISIPGFTKHQHCHKDEAASKLPGPETGSPLHRQEPSNVNQSAMLAEPGASTVQPPGKHHGSTPLSLNTERLNTCNGNLEKNRPAKPSAPSAFGQVLNAWLDAWGAEKGTPYTPTGGDKAQLGRLLNAIGRDGLVELPRLFLLYLQDSDPFLAKQGWSLAYFCTHCVNKYRLPGANGVPRPSSKWEDSRRTSIAWAKKGVA